MSYQGKVTASGLNIRSGPSTSYSIVGSYSNGTVITIQSEQNGWGKTSKGWVSLKYVSKITTESTSTPANTGNKAIDALLNCALAEVGYLEKASNSNLDSKTGNAGYNNWTKYARDLDAMKVVYNGPKNGFAWCDMFVDWCFITTSGLETAIKMINQPKKGLGAGCTYSARYYKDMGRFDMNPRPGDQIFFKNNDGGMAHTGIVEKVDSSRVYTIEGNTSSASGVVANGGSVERKSYSLGYAKIGGYGHPNWALVADRYTDNNDVTTDNDDITQEEFNKLMDAWLTEKALINDNPTWSKDARDWAENEKIIQGDEKGNKMYKKYLTREEMITILYRIFGKG